MLVFVKRAFGDYGNVNEVVGIEKLATIKKKMINPKEKYFLASFRYSKNKPEDFNLIAVDEEDSFKDKDGNKWKEETMWDNGWGNEYGFVRIPFLTPDELWEILMESNVYENQKGAAEFLERQFPNELKSKLTVLFRPKNKLSRNVTKRLSKLEVLNTGININKTLGKHFSEINKDFEEWKNLKENYEQLKTESIWKKIKKL